MDAKQVLEEIVKKSNDAMAMAIKAALDKGAPKDELAEIVYKISEKTTADVINVLAETENSKEVMLSVAFGILRMLADTLKIYLEDNNINIQAEDIEDETEIPGAPDSMYL